MMTISTDWLAKSRLLSLQPRNLVGGHRSDSGGAMLQKFSPRDGALLYQLAVGDASEVEAAVSVAKRAFEDGRWSQLSISRRKTILFRLAELIEAHTEELSLLETLDVGKPISDALSFDLPAAVSIFRFNAEAADKPFGRVYAADRTNLSYQLRRPAGVVAAIVGWNFPLLLASMKVAPVLAAGNSLVLKPSELTSLSAVRIAELALEAGLPEGVLNVVHGGPSVGEALARHGDVDLLSFTGSTQTGKRLLIASGETNMKRLILECGGKAPNIVFDDCPDLELVAGAIAARAFFNQGQVCTASSRLLVQQGVKNELVRRVIQKATALRLGDPLLPETNFGPLVSAGHRRKVWGYIESGQSEGVEIAYRGDADAPHSDGFYLAPVIFDGVNPENTIAREEIFGPVLSIMSFKDETDAVRIANATLYGLSAIVWTKDLGRAHRLSQALQMGWITINAGEPVGGPVEGALPVGGHKQSGVGVEGGIEGIEAYMTQTAVQLFV
jgi:acyl-CoA reductase-like NAD-dependent aldehyde dehydrogenase